MGLHTDVKKHLRERFPDSVNDDVPSVACDVCITDMMWILFRFNSSDDQAVGDDLIDFMWHPLVGSRIFLMSRGFAFDKMRSSFALDCNLRHYILERFFLAGGKTYVCCFDIPEFVPRAKEGFALP